MWVSVTSTKLLACRRCCSSDGRATIAACAFAVALERDGSDAGAGVATETSTRGGATAVLVRPTTPVNTTISTAAPSTPIAHASSHAPRSEGGDGGAANWPSKGLSDIAAHPTHGPRRSCWCRVIALMRTPTPCLSTLAATICFACCTQGAPALAATRSAAAAVPAPPSSATPPPAPALSAAQQHYLALAQAGVAHAEKRWRDPRRGWYDARLDDRERYPLATIWDIVPLFESLDAIAIAEPTATNRRAVARFGK